MIVGVRGVLESTGPDWARLSVGGVTLQVFVPGNAVSKLGAIGATVSLHTLLRIREEQPVLYG
jgi:Holliday junction resolvasome RuvABC DNA-binding subunit